MIKIVDDKGLDMPLILLVLIMLPLIVGLACLSIGRIRISPLDIIMLFKDLIQANEYDKTLHAVVINIRLPRLILALIVGQV